MSAEAQTVRLCARDGSDAASSRRGICYSANDDLIRAALAPAANFGTECTALPVESPRGSAPSTDQDAERRRSEALEVAWKRDRRVDIWQRFASPGSSLCKKPRLLGLPRVVHPISVIRTMQSFQCGTLMRDRGCAPAERRDGNRMRAENGAAPNRSARPARWLQLRSPLSDCLRLKTGENTCTLEREACRRAADPFAGFPLHFVGMRALEVGAEKAPAGEIVEGARDHRHGQMSCGRDGARGPVIEKRNQRRSHSQHDWAFRGVVASFYVSRRASDYHRSARRRDR